MKNDGYALITGPSRGLGMAFARALAQRHCNRVLVARSPEPLRAFADELRRANPVSVVAIQVDLSTAGACQILAEQLSRGGIPIELLVNNVGFGLRGEFRANSLPRQLEMLRLNNQAIVELTYSLPSGNAGAGAERHHQHLLDCGLSAYSFCERLLCNQGVSDHVFTGP